MNFFKYIHAVGTGVKRNRDLSMDEAKDMMSQILQKKAHNEEIAAFLLGWRLKPETTDEFRGVVEACEKYIKYQPIKNSIELGYPFDGKVKNPYIFTLVAKILQPTGLNIVLTGDDLQPAKGGITTKDIYKNIDFSKNIHYFEREDYFKEFAQLTDIRKKLGLRTGLNTIEKLPNVAKSDFAISGVFHKPYVKKYIDIFAPKYKRVAILQGNEGTPELFSKSRLWVATTDKQTDQYIIEPKKYGIVYEKSWQKITMQDSIKQIQNPSNELIKLAKLNAAIYMFVAQKANTIDEACEMLNL